MNKHIVIWPQVAVFLGADRQVLDRGDSLPDGVDQVQLDNLVSIGAIAGVHDPAALAEIVLDPEPVVATPLTADPATTPVVTDPAVTAPLGGTAEATPPLTAPVDPVVTDPATKARGRGRS